MNSLLRTNAYIDGRWIEGSSRFPVVNPATGTVIAEVSDLGSAETAAAIAAAERAMPAWAALPARDRAAVLRDWYQLIMAHQDELAAIMTAEQGKPLAEARGEIAYGAGFVEWFAEEAKRAYGDVVPTHRSDQRIIVIKQPVGVVAAITPWNFPSAMITRKVAPALAAGCAVVLKPSELTPLSALALAELGERAGIPKGLFNIVTGRDAAAIGKALMDSPVVRKLTFTGSTNVGKLLMAQAAATVKKVSLELGGNAPFIVFNDADLDAAVDGAILSKFRNAGQTCVCANRFYVEAGVHDQFVALFAAKVAKLVIGNGADPEANVGPLIDENAVAKVQRHIADAVDRGAQLVLGGQRAVLGGTFFEPTILTGITPAMAVTHEETFGPLAPVSRFVDEDDIIAQANDSRAGLAAYIYTRDIARVWRVAEALQFGMVGINTGIFSTETAPFGGIKESGLGREGSRHGLDDYCEMKYLCLGEMG